MNFETPGALNTPESDTNRPKKQERSKESVFEKQLTPFEKLTASMERLSDEINALVAEKYGMSLLVNKDGRINMDNFSKTAGGIYTEESISKHSAKIIQDERKHSGSFDAITQQRYKKDYGIETEEGIIAHHRKEKEKMPSSQAEMAVTGLFYKMLKGRFIIARSSEFDDYEHGMDNIILDMETGALVCAFDEILENPHDEGRPSKKIEKVKKILEKGGAEVNYGIALTDEKKLVRAHVQNVPVFYLNLIKEDLRILAERLGDEEISADERRIFSQLIRSIESQRSIAKNNIAEAHSVSKHLNTKLTELFPSLVEMYELCGISEELVL